MIRRKQSGPDRGRGYYTQDANWNTTALVDAATGDVVERYIYDAYGKATFLDGDWEPTEIEGYGDGTASAFANEVLYGGYALDAESGLYHTDYREYHCTLGRFIQVDPIGLAAGPNVYAYCDSRPTAATDPSGLEPDWEKVERGIWGTAQGATEFLAYMPSTSVSTGNLVMMGKGLGDLALGINKTIEGLRGVAGPGASESVVGAGVDVASKVITGGVSQDARNISTLLDSVFSFGASGFARGREAAAAVDSRYRGGAFEDLPSVSGQARHHMPAKTVSPIPQEAGPAIQMDWRDHLLTSSYGSSRAANAYRSELSKMIQGGDWRKAMATEIRDVRRAAIQGSGDRTKYNGAIRQMLNYAGWL